MEETEISALFIVCGCLDCQRLLTLLCSSATCCWRSDVRYCSTQTRAFSDLTTNLHFVARETNVVRFFAVSRSRSSRTAGTRAAVASRNIGYSE